MKKSKFLILIVLVATIATQAVMNATNTKQNVVSTIHKNNQASTVHPDDGSTLGITNLDTGRTRAELKKITSRIPPSSGDWRINDTVILKDRSLIINGSIIVETTGALILENTNLYMNLNSDGEYWIDVYGNLTLLKSVITAYNTSNNYYIRVFSGAKLRIEDSQVSYAGYTWGSNGDKTGLWINTNNTIIHNTTIHNNYYGIFLFYSNSSRIINSTIRFTSYGIFLRGSSLNVITNVLIENSSMYGLAMDSSSNMNAIYNNTIKNGSFYGMFLYSCYDNKIFFNNFINNKYHSNIIPDQLTTPSNITYIYKEKTQHNKLGNYWDSYNGGDPDNDGIGNETYLGDTHPLMEPTWNYIIGDTDHDNLNDIFEEALGTSLNNGDSDYDGLPDGWEVKYHLDALNSSDATLDLDNDKLTNLQEYTYGTNPLNSDTDGDGLPDGWEVNYGLDPLNNDSDMDNDGDTLTNLEEFEYGTDPTNSDTDSDNIPDGWEILYGLSPLNYSDANTDPDNDGLSNLKEYQQNTNPKNPDTDNDGMPDGWEVLHNLNPTLNDSSEDLEGDGLINLEEYQHGTNPTTADTDSDGMPDGWEVSYGLDPTNSSDAQQDIDNDGLSNAREFWFGTDPTNPDTDGDGYKDGIEILHGSDPLNSSDYIAPQTQNDTSPQNTSESSIPAIYSLAVLALSITTIISLGALILTLRRKNSP